MQCYLALNRQYTTADYLSIMTDQQLKRTLTKYRLSEHSLAIETGRLPAEQRLCCHCSLSQPKTESHFLTKCEKYTNIRETHFPKFKSIINFFFETIRWGKLPILLREACHRLRDREWHSSADTYICQERWCRKGEDPDVELQNQKVYSK